MLKDVLQPKERPEIRSDVEMAFLNRLQENVLGYSESNHWQDNTVKQSYGESSIDVGRRLGNIIRTVSSPSDDEIIDLPFFPQPNEAYTEKIGDYHWYLRYAAEIVFKHAGVSLTPGLRQSLLKKDLAHEFEHALKGKGEKGLVIKYSVGFYETPDGSSVPWRPQIVLTGQASRKTIRSITQGTSWKSKGDEIAINGE